MDGHGDPGSGLGPASSGPEFAPPTASAPPPGTPVPPLAYRSPVARPPVGPTPSRLPALVTAVVVGLVALVVIAASLVAHQADTHIAARPGPTRVVVPTPTEQANRIQFSTSTGSGELVLVERRWVDGGSPEPENGSYLKVEIEIDCTAGTISYDPENFQAFDHNGDLFDLLLDEADEPVLDIGTLEAGMQARGGLAFDIPRGAVTLLMSEDNDQSVTALRVPD
jgi:hypothetical protein